MSNCVSTGCNCNHQTTSNERASEFLNLNGIPYLVGEEVDWQSIRQVDRSMIIDSIRIDDSDAMRAVIDVSIDDIGVTSDGYPNLKGNAAKYHEFLRLVADQALKLKKQLPVIRRGIIVRVNYQLENYRTRQILRSMVEDIPIRDRSYFLEVNPQNVHDNALVTNFSDTVVSTVNDFTHGRDRMLLRITDIQLFYEVVQPITLPCIKQQLCGDNNYFPHGYDNIAPGSVSEYYYQQSMQNQHFIGECPPYGHYDPAAQNPSPNTWSSFNRFYHFDDNCANIVLHYNEIYDAKMKANLVPCGKVKTNRAFIINPGHRIIYKFSIWKNDVLTANNVVEVAKALGVENWMPMPPNHKPPHHHDEDIKKLIALLDDERKKNAQLTDTVNSMIQEIKELKAALTGGPATPPTTEEGDDGHCEDCDATHDEISSRIDELGADYEALAAKVKEEDIDPMTEEQLQELFNAAKENVFGEE